VKLAMIERFGIDDGGKQSLFEEVDVAGESR
jgi:hypothetical protein